MALCSRCAPCLTSQPVSGGGPVCKLDVVARFMQPSTPVPLQAELLFEVAGLFAAGQFLFKMMFADEREKALTEIK